MGNPRNIPLPTLVEGEDYYIEHGRWVFTANYHLKRGYCCDSSCRHCPYPLPDNETRPGTKI